MLSFFAPPCKNSNISCSFQDEGNKAALEELESCLFLVCLDDDTQNPTDQERSLHSRFRQMLSGNGPFLNGTNRWFDKTMQVNAYTTCSPLSIPNPSGTTSGFFLETAHRFVRWQCWHVLRALCRWRRCRSQRDWGRGFGHPSQSGHISCSTRDQEFGTTWYHSSWMERGSSHFKLYRGSHSGF